MLQIPILVPQDGQHLAIHHFFEFLPLNNNLLHPIELKLEILDAHIFCIIKIPPLFIEI